MQIIAECFVLSVCMALGMFFTVIQFTRYLNNEDYSVLSYRSLEFNSDSKDGPPVYALCFDSIFGKILSNRYYNRYYEIFLKDNTTQESNKARIECYAEFIWGISTDKSNFNCTLTEEIIERYFDINYDELVEDLIKNLVISFQVEDIDSLGILINYDIHCTGKNSECLKIPLEKVYQDHYTVCYSRNFDYEKGFEMTEDHILLNATKMLEWNLDFSTYVHHKGQFVRHRATKGIKPDFIFRTKYVDRIQKFYPQGYLYTVDHVIKDVVVLRTRGDGIIPCNETLSNEDAAWRGVLENWAGCTPSYWTTFTAKTSLNKELSGCLLHQYEYLKEVLIFGDRRKTFRDASKLYLNPCSTMQKDVSTVHFSDPIDEDLGKFIFKRAGLNSTEIDCSIINLSIEYGRNKYTEIKNTQAYDEETWLSQTGGYIG